MEFTETFLIFFFQVSRESILEQAGYKKMLLFPQPNHAASKEKRKKIYLWKGRDSPKCVQLPKRVGVFFDTHPIYTHIHTYT